MSKSTAQPVVRRAQHHDIQAIASFNQQMARETEGLELIPAVIEAGVSGMIDNPERGFYLVVEDSSNPDPPIVASLMVTTEWSDWRNGTFWWIQSVYVIPGWRRRGLYRLMYQNVKQLAAGDGGVCGFRLYVEHENRVAQETYASLGMGATHYHIYEELVPSLRFTES